MKRIRLQRVGLKKLRLPDERFRCCVHFNCTKESLSIDRPDILLEEGIVLLLENGLETALEKNGATEYELPTAPTYFLVCEDGEALQTENEEIMNLEQQ